jgi:hypothetical protein
MDRIDVRGGTQGFPQQFNASMASAVIRNALGAAQAAFNESLSGVTPQSTPDRLATILTAWSTAVRRCRTDSLSSSEAQAAAEQSVTVSAAEAIDDLERLYNVALETYRRTIADDLPSLNADLARQAVGAAWNASLNAGLQDRVVDRRSGQPTNLTVLTEELLSWRRVQMPHDLRAADYLFQSDVERLRHRRYQLADDAQRLRLDIVEVSRRGQYRVVIAFQQARHALGYLKGSATDVEVVIPGWGMTERIVKL